jgi:hypothetical protein
MLEALAVEVLVVLVEITQARKTLVQAEVQRLVFIQHGLAQHQAV